MAESKEDSSQGRPEVEYVDGAAIAARILRRYPTEQRGRLISAMQKQSPQLAQKVQERMYNFEELKNLTSKGAETLVRETQHRDLVAAVAGASSEVKEKLFQSMSERKRAIVKEDADVLQKDIEPAQVKEAQWRMLQKLDELREKGAVRTTGSKEDTWA